MVDLLLVYHSSRRIDHSDLFAVGEMVSGDDGTVRHWIRRRCMLALGAYVSG